MTTGLDMQFDVGLAQRLSPALVAFTQLLALSPAELEAAVEAELAANPALDRADSRGCRRCGLPSHHALCRRCGSGGVTAPDDGIMRLACTQTVAERLLHDAAPMLAEADRSIAEHVAGSLDRHGFLTASPEEIAGTLGLPPVRVREVLGKLQRAWPVGVAARDVRECLLAQLDALDAEGDGDPLARTIVDHHLPELARGAYGRIAAETGASRESVLRARDAIRRRLHPYPAIEADHPAPVRAPVAPDIAFHISEDDPEAIAVVLVEPLRVRPVVNPLWAELANGEGALGSTARAQVRARVRDAEAFIRRLERRWDTSVLVGRAIAERQRAYIQTADPRRLGPLTRAEVAAAVGLHESTVSRAVAGRHALLPTGRVVSMATFFRREAGVQAVLRDLVAHERRPYTDAELAGRLAALGHHVARRTVAKYRDRLGILPAPLR
jgi:RNA polymerase sigma-54 factor